MIWFHYIYILQCPCITFEFHRVAVSPSSPRSADLALQQDSTADDIRCVLTNAERTAQTNTALHEYLLLECNQDLLCNQLLVSTRSMMTLTNCSFTLLPPVSICNYFLIILLVICLYISEVTNKLKYHSWLCIGNNHYNLRKYGGGGYTEMFDLMKERCLNKMINQVVLDSMYHFLLRWPLKGTM
jgi:hypothetical protein